MYQIISAVGKPSTVGSGWVEVDVVGKSFSALQNDYTEIYITVTHPFLNGYRLTTLANIRPHIRDLSKTLTEFFTEHADSVITNSPGSAAVDKASVKFSDAFYAGYSLQRATYARTADVIPDFSDADTLVLKKDGVDARMFQRNCLVAINGLLYRSTADDRYIYVPGGCDSVKHCYRNEVGIVNFAAVGEISTHPIKDAVISRMHPQQPLKNQIVITFPELDLTNKSIGIVIGGILTINEPMIFAQLSSNSFVIDMQNIDLVGRYQQLREIINTDFLGLELNGQHQRQLSREQLSSDEVITKLLEHMLSYLVVIDSDNIDVTRVQLRATTTTGHYTSYSDLTSPAFYETGELAIYWKQYDDGFWSITTNDNHRDDFLYHQAPVDLSPFPADNQRPYAARGFKRLFATHMTAQKLKIIGGTGGSN